MNSAIGLVVTRRNCSGRPCPDRTAACASAPSATICEATGSSFTPAVVRVIVAPFLKQLVTEVLAERGQGLGNGGFAHVQHLGGVFDRTEPGHHHERAELGERHR